jgi:hypothetical protein
MKMTKWIASALVVSALWGVIGVADAATPTVPGFQTCRDFREYLMSIDHMDPKPLYASMICDDVHRLMVVTLTSAGMHEPDVGWRFLVPLKRGMAMLLGTPSRSPIRDLCGRNRMSRSPVRGRLEGAA